MEKRGNGSACRIPQCLGGDRGVSSRRFNQNWEMKGIVHRGLIGGFLHLQSRMLSQATGSYLVRPFPLRT